MSTLLLENCLTHITVAKPAFDAFIKAIRSYPFFKQASNDATQLIAEPSSSPRLLFEDSGSYKLVATLVDRITYLGVSELLLSPAEVSLKHYLSSGLLETGEVGDATNNLLIGALLERQVFSLQASLYKPDVRKAVRNLLDDALSVYDAESVPIRRSGILVLCLEVRYRDVEGGLQDGDVEDIGREVESLLSREVSPHHIEMD